MGYKYIKGEVKPADNSVINLGGTGVDVAMPQGSVDSDDLAGLSFAEVKLSYTDNPANGNQLIFTIDGKTYTITVATGGGGQSQTTAVGVSGNNRTATIYLSTTVAAPLSADQFYTNLATILESGAEIKAANDNGSNTLKIQSSKANKSFNVTTETLTNASAVTDNMMHKFLRYQNGVAQEQDAGAMFQSIVAPGGQFNGNITFAGTETVDGRDVSADGTKLDTIESNADVTDATNVNAAGAVMESDYDAHTMMIATSDNTPVATTIAASRIVGRIAFGNI